VKAATTKVPSWIPAITRKIPRPVAGLRARIWTLVNSASPKREAKLNSSLFIWIQGVVAYSQGGWQPEAFAQKNERAFSEGLNLEDLYVWHFSYLAHGVQSRRSESMSQYRWKHHAFNRRVRAMDQSLPAPVFLP
jgi:hypothetical protein